MSGEDSIEDTYNAVVIAAEDDGKAYIGAQASNAASIKRYGFMQHIETVTENPCLLYTSRCAMSPAAAPTTCAAISARCV